MRLQKDREEGRIQDQRGELRGFERTDIAKKGKERTREQKDAHNAKLQKGRQARKEAEEAQAAFQKLKETLKKEGKL